MRYGVVLAGAVVGISAMAVAENLTVPLPGVQVTRIRATFTCGADGVALGLPAQPFVVEYVNAGENHLAVLPLHGKSMVFANVMSGSGARYAADRYIWWDAGSRGVTLYAEGVDGHPKADCRLLKKQ
jgi:membrane-bound inhibitor of C-type lysozyme